MSFIEQTFFRKSSLAMISFMGHVFGVVSNKVLLFPRLSRISPGLSARNVIVFRLTFRSVIHFELIFVKGVKSVSRFL